MQINLPFLTVYRGDTEKTDKVETRLAWAWSDFEILEIESADLEPAAPIDKIAFRWMSEDGIWRATPETREPYADANFPFAPRIDRFTPRELKAFSSYVIPRNLVNWKDCTARAPSRDTFTYRPGANIEWDDTAELAGRIQDYLTRNVRTCGEAVLTRLAAPSAAFWGTARDRYWHDQLWVSATRLADHTQAPALYFPLAQTEGYDLPRNTPFQPTPRIRILAKEAARFEPEDLRADSLLSIATFLSSGGMVGIGPANLNTRRELAEIVNRHDAREHHNLEAMAEIMSRMERTLFPGNGGRILDAVISNWVDRPVMVQAFTASKLA